MTKKLLSKIEKCIFAILGIIIFIFVVFGAVKLLFNMDKVDEDYAAAFKYIANNRANITIEKGLSAYEKEQVQNITLQTVLFELNKQNITHMSKIIACYNTTDEYFATRNNSKTMTVVNNNIGNWSAEKVNYIDLELIENKWCEVVRQ